MHQEQQIKILLELDRLLVEADEELEKAMEKATHSIRVARGIAMAMSMRLTELENLTMNQEGAS